MEEMRAQASVCLGISISSCPCRALPFDRRSHVTMAVVFKKHTPNLVVADVARSLTFYRDLLGFSVIATVPEEAPYVFTLLQRDGLDLFLNDAAAVRHEPGNTAAHVGKSGVSLYFDVEGIHALLESLKDRGTIVAPLERKFYGVTEFSVTDPDGYLVTFAERLD
jgi:lactoylglutathione lyase